MKYVYRFEEGKKEMKNILGGKGANLSEMTKLGLPIPKGFIVTTEACLNYYENQGKIKSNIVEEIVNHLNYLEITTGKTFGKGKNPLLVSVRSGAPISMPGMMDSILNLGLNDEVANTLIQNTQNPKFVYDSYRRFIMMYANVVKGYPKDIFEKKLEEYKKAKNVTKDIDLDAEDFKKLVEEYKQIYESFVGKEIPTEPNRQLLEAISAIFRSWNNERAIYYRKLNEIPDNLGTAVNVQEMVYGNFGENSGTGVAFTRVPTTGEKKIYGEYLMNAQGEDVVSGVRTPSTMDELKKQMPEIYQEFCKYATLLEKHYRDMQDMEFTIENGKLYILQTRAGKRTGMASIKIAVDLVKEEMITKEEAIMRIDTNQLEQLLHPRFDENVLKTLMPIGKGLAASPGAAVGSICTNPKEIKKRKEREEKTILVRTETSPEDIEGMNYAEGILTSRGGMTSHAAVVARGMGVCCVSGCEELIIDEEKEEIYFQNGITLHFGDIISIDGETGYIYKGTIPKKEITENALLQEFLSWLDEIDTIKVRANADNERDAILAKKMGATGIGLCRTEHMFFSKERIFSFRKMILSNTMAERVKALNDILPYQRVDFYRLFKVMAPNPVVIRYLDPPLHEFLPKKEEEIEELSKALHSSKEEILKRINKLKEFNPMMGHRGCRLMITYPEIAIMQTKAIMEAIILLKQDKKDITPEIMIPLVVDSQEFEFVKKIIDDTAYKIMRDHSVSIKYEVGTMMETPRACLTADQIAHAASFFSFGTNDLTQLTYGFSRDDSGKFLNEYYKNKIFNDNPFANIDEHGVGNLMKLAVENSKKIRPKISLGICGEHGGNLKSIQFCYELGLDYVSCSPYRIPIAKLAAAQAKIKKKEKVMK